MELPSPDILRLISRQLQIYEYIKINLKAAADIRILRFRGM
jgi:hypothetical protein